MAKKIFTALILVMALSLSASAAETGESKVLARVGSQDITEAEVLEFIRPYGQQALMLYASEQGRKMIINDVILMRVYALEGEEEKLDQTAEFQEKLAAAKRAMFAEAAMRNVIKNITVSDDEALKFYNENTKMFTQPEKVHARHILVSGDELLRKVQDDLKAGKSFDVVAKEYSQDPGSAENGGELPEFSRGMMVPEFEAAAFALKNSGDVSEPVKTQFGWHIIKLEGKTPEAVIPFEQVKARILQDLREQKTQEAIEAKGKLLEEKYKVERF